MSPSSVTQIDNFGTMPDGTPVQRYRLDNGRGLRAEVLSLGGIVRQLDVPDKTGRSSNVLLSAGDVKQITDGTSPYIGAIIGRVGNRIGGAKFTLDGKEYKLAANNGEATLHGGKVGYDKRIWTVTPMKADDGEAAVKLSLTDPAGTEGFPGTVKVDVVYTLTKDNAWRIDYTATSDAPTPINLTQHAYFNLKDAGQSPVLDHVVTIHAKDYTPSGADLVPHGAIEPVRGTPLDYTSPKPIGRDFDKLTNTPRGVDHNFVLGNTFGKTVTAAEVYEPTTGRTMTVTTDQPGVQFYTGNFLDKTCTGPGGVAYAQHTGFCFESQHFPNSANVPSYPSTILRPGETFHSTTEYHFGVK